MMVLDRWDDGSGWKSPGWLMLIGVAALAVYTFFSIPSGDDIKPAETLLAFSGLIAFCLWGKGLRRPVLLLAWRRCRRAIDILVGRSGSSSTMDGLISASGLAGETLYIHQCGLVVTRQYAKYLHSLDIGSHWFSDDNLFPCTFE